MRAGPFFAVVLGLLVPSWARYHHQPFVNTKPQQVHIAYGEDPTTEMYVVWNTVIDTQTSCTYMAQGSTELHTAYGVSRPFRNLGSSGRLQFVHRVKITGLIPGQLYFYRCGGDRIGWSARYPFRPMKSGQDWSPRLALYGDLGTSNAQSLPRLKRDTAMGMYDAILHVGDFAYDMNFEQGKVGDEFMKAIEPMAAVIPYMTCPGNHEWRNNFTNYKHRFVMPSDQLSDRMFYSYNMGPAHIISFNTEYYFFLQYGWHQAVNQFIWLEKDLQEATKPENRARHPWIIAMGHRPMYCSNSDHDDCTKNESIVRTGLPFLHTMGLEDLFYKYGVDLMLWAHEHSYERLWPIYNRKVYNGSKAEPYTNPGAPVHIITGSAGCWERHNTFVKNPADWSAFRSDDYGYTRMTIHNASHLYMEQVSDDQGGKIVDSVWLKKDNHGPYPPRPTADPSDDVINDMEKLLAGEKKYGYRLFPVDNDGGL